MTQNFESEKKTSSFQSRFFISPPLLRNSSWGLISSKSEKREGWVFASLPPRSEGNLAPSSFASQTKGDKDGDRKKQKKLVDVSGLVTHNLSNGKFRVKLENGVQVIAHLSGKIRQNRIKIVVGDTVTVELSPYDLTKGRIVYRQR